MDDYEMCKLVMMFSCIVASPNLTLNLSLPSPTDTDSHLVPTMRITAVSFSVRL